MSDSSDNALKGGWRHTLVTVGLCLLIAAGTFGIVRLIYSTQPKAQREGATRRAPALVETVSVTAGDYRPRLDVLGTVEPAREIVLQPRVTGEIVVLSDAFEPGGFVRKGQMLMRLDSKDFLNRVILSESSLTEARAELEVELGRQRAAQKELEIMQVDKPLEDADRALVLREPQVAAAKARVAAAEADLAQAKLDLSRTEIRAPFDAQIVARAVNVGSQVTPNTNLARLVGDEEFWVIASVPLRHLPRIDMAMSADPQSGSMVLLRNRTAWPEGVYREGRVRRLIGEVDQETRLARVLISIRDPLGLKSSERPLMLGTVVEASIEGQQLEDVVRLERSYVRGDSTVWVFADGKLDVREVRILQEDAGYAYISEGLTTGDSVVTTHLASARTGIELKQFTGAEKEGEVAANKP